MLILTRKQGESIIINNNIRVYVHEVINGRVSLGVEAPRDVPVHREEIQEAINKGIPPTAK